MMEIVCVAVAAFSLLSVGHSAPVSSCESLIQPLEIQSRDLLGKWIYIAETTDIPGTKALTKMLVESVWWNITAAEESDKFNTFQNQKTLGLCLSFKSNMTLNSNTLTMEQPYYATAILLSTRCPDCLVIYSNNTLGSSIYKGLQLLSRRSSVSDAELEDFKKQVECLDLPSPTILDPEKGFCPDPSLTQETATIDLTGTVNSDDINQLDKILKSENGVQILMKLVTSAVGHFQQN